MLTKRENGGKCGESSGGSSKDTTEGYLVISCFLKFVIFYPGKRDSDSDKQFYVKLSPQPIPPPPLLPTSLLVA